MCCRPRGSFQREHEMNDNLTGIKQDQNLTDAQSGADDLPSPLGPASEERVVFAVENITCAQCSTTVKTAMLSVAGAKSVAVDFESKSAAVVFDPSQTTIAAIAAASAEVGHPAQVTGG